MTKAKKGQTMHKKILSALLSAAMLCSYISNTAAASTDSPKDIYIDDYTQLMSETADEFFALCKSHASYEEICRYMRENMVEDTGGGGWRLLPHEAVDCFINERIGLIKVDYTVYDHTQYSFLEDEPWDGSFFFDIYTDKYRYIRKRYHLDERTVYSVSEVLSDINLNGDEKVVWITLEDTGFFSEIDNSEFYDCAKGWNTIDGEKYYVKSDGTPATSSCTINGIRYKFGKNGVCGGKYTGWTKNSKGLRYWKDGVLQKNTEVTTKSGKTYTIDKNGYAKLKK